MAQTDADALEIMMDCTIFWIGVYMKPNCIIGTSLA